MQAFVFVIRRLLTMAFHLADNSFNDFLAVLIEISNAIASSCLMYSRVSRDLSSMPAKLCNAKLATAIHSHMDEPGTCGIASPLRTSSVASRIHSSLQKVSPKIMHMLCKTKHVETKSGTFFKCTSTLFERICHLPLSIPNARSTHMRVELWTKFQWYSSRERPSLWPLNGANIQGRHGYATSPTKVYGESLPVSQCWPIAVLAHRLASCIEPTHPMSKS